MAQREIEEAARVLLDWNPFGDDAEKSSTSFRRTSGLLAWPAHSVLDG